MGHNPLALRALRVRIQLFRVAHADMNVKAQEALMLASELGLLEEAQSDMFGDLTLREDGSYNSTDKIQALIDAREALK